MMYVIGDTHGDIERYKRIVAPRVRAGDIVLHVGDFGFWDEEIHGKFLDEVEEAGYTLAFVDGNHENYPKMEALPDQQLWGGVVGVLRPHIVRLKRGEVYAVEGRTVFAMGGAMSQDRYMRREGESWFPQEIPGDEDCRHAEESLNKVERKVDCVLTHAAPIETFEYMVRRGVMDGRPQQEEFAFLNYLQYVCDTVEYGKWFFGHYHVDMELWRGQTAVLDEVISLD